MNRIEIRADREPWALNRVSLRVFSKSDSGYAVAKPLTFKTFSRAEMEGTIIDPILSISPEDAQQLMDELYRIGIRPTEGAGSVGQLAAVTRHLEDMRCLVFKTPPQ